MPSVPEAPTAICAFLAFGWLEAGVGLSLIDEIEGLLVEALFGLAIFSCLTVDALPWLCLEMLPGAACFSRPWLLMLTVLNGLFPWLKTSST